MFKVYYKYGTMNSGKSIELLANAHNYQTKGVKTYIMTPRLDNRAGEGVVKARIGLTAKADFVIDSIKDNPEFTDKLTNFIKQVYEQDGVIFIDECQFIDYETVHTICDLCRALDQVAPIQSENFCLLAYGLLTDYNSRLFDGSKAWVEEADSMHEVKTVCHYCNRKATRNLLRQDLARQADNNHSNIVIGDEEYQSVCSYHYFKYHK